MSADAKPKSPEDLTKMHFDSLGSWNPSKAGYVAQAWIEQWPIKALGNRPQDWVVRDVLLKSLLADGRLKLFHQLVAKPDPWLVARGHGKAELQLSVLHYLHMRHLAQLLPAAAEKKDAQPGEYALLSRLWKCPPTGYLPAACPPTAMKQRSCGIVKACPWCNARLALRVYRQLAKKECNSWILLSRVDGHEYFGHGFSESEYFGELLADRTSDAWYQNPWYWPLEINFYRKLRVCQLRTIYSSISAKMSEWTTRLGIEPSLSTFRIGSHAFNDHGIECAAFKFEARMLAPAGELKDPELVAFLTHHDRLRCGTLRRLLPAVFARPPLFLFDDVQFWSYMHATRKFKLNRGLPPQESRQSSFVPMTSAESRLRRANGVRKVAAQNRVQNILAAARELWPEVQKEIHAAGKSEGRPPYRRCLAEKLAKQGLKPSAWTMRQVMRSLQAGT